MFLQISNYYKEFYRIKGNFSAIFLNY